MKNRQGYLHIHDTLVQVWEDEVDSDGLFQVFRRALARMRKRGWELQRDPEVEKRYPSIARTHWVGRKGDLEVELETAGRCLKVGFFQNVSFENPNGGRYDFQKLKRMAAASRSMRLQCLAEMHVLARFLHETWGYPLKVRDGFGHRPVEITPLVVRDIAEDRRDGPPLEIFNRDWGSDRFERDETGWPSQKEISTCWSRHDRHGKLITQGVTKYIRDRGGRLARGQVFGGINGNWWFVSNGSVIEHVHAAECFDCEDPEIFDRRSKNAVHLLRLREELAKATKAEDYRRVATLGAVLARFTTKRQEAA